MDAVHLARLLRLDEVTSVALPTVDQEAARDLVRTREDCRGDLMRARHRLSKLLLRHGTVYYGGAAWTRKHDQWLRTDALTGLIAPSTRMTFDNDYEAVLSVKARRNRLDAQIAELAADSEFTPLVRRLGCLRGVGPLTGFALAVEIGDWHRFTGNSIGAFVVLVTSEYSSGQSGSQGSVTKTGNGHVRRLLVEAAWHHRPRYTARQTMRIAGSSLQLPLVSVATRATGGSTSTRSRSSTAANGPPSPTTCLPAPRAAKHEAPAMEASTTGASPTP